MPDPATEFVPVARLDEIPAGRCKRVEIEGRPVGLFNLGGTIHAIDDTCTHAEASLCEGDIEGTEVLCPLHFASFDIITGECTGPPADEDLVTHEVRVEGDEVSVRLRV